jgi:hypothetical protein
MNRFSSIFSQLLQLFPQMEFLLGVNIFIANQTKIVIQKTRGHASPPIRKLSQFPSGAGCPFFSSQKYDKPQRE